MATAHKYIAAPLRLRFNFKSKPSQIYMYGGTPSHGMAALGGMAGGLGGMLGANGGMAERPDVLGFGLGNMASGPATYEEYLAGRSPYQQDLQATREQFERAQAAQAQMAGGNGMANPGMTNQNVTAPMTFATESPANA